MANNFNQQQPAYIAGNVQQQQQIPIQYPYGIANNTTPMYPDYRNIERAGGYMYYPTGGGNNSGSGGSNGGNSGGSGGTSYYTEIPSIMGRDPREGRSPMRRRMYMEGKEMHNDPNSQLQELEAYLKELSTDITEMVKDASQEEKATLREKMTMLANKIM